MYELDCAYIQSTGRVYRDQQVFIIGYLAGNDDLLLVTAGQSSGRSLCAAPRTDIEFLDQIQRMLLGWPSGPECMFRIRCFLTRLQVRLSSLENSRTSPCFWRSAGILEIPLSRSPSSLVEDILAQHGDGAGFCFSKTGQNLNQFRLSVSVDTGQTYNLALAAHPGGSPLKFQPHGNPLRADSPHAEPPRRPPDLSYPP